MFHKRIAMSSFESIMLSLNDWGYWLVFFGSMVEGEVILLSASAASALGYMDIHKVFAIAFCTTVCADQGLFFLGRQIGTDWLIRRVPKLENARTKAFNLLHKMDILFIFSFRFIYGIRTISPLIIGSAKVKPIRFIICNIISGLTWAGLSCWLGYSIADTIADGEFNYKDLVLWITVTLVTIFGIIVLVPKLKKRKK